MRLKLGFLTCRAKINVPSSNNNLLVVLMTEMTSDTPIMSGY